MGIGLDRHVCEAAVPEELGELVAAKALGQPPSEDRLRALAVSHFEHAAAGGVAGHDHAAHASDPHQLRERLRLSVSEQLQDAIDLAAIEALVREVEVEHVAHAEVDGEGEPLRAPPRLRDHVGYVVESEDAARGPDLGGERAGVVSGTAARIEHALAGPEVEQAPGDGLVVARERGAGDRVQIGDPIRVGFEPHRSARTPTPPQGPEA